MKQKMSGNKLRIPIIIAMLSIAIGLMTASPAQAVFTEEEHLMDPTKEDYRFGHSVAISGDTAVVGAPDDGTEYDPDGIITYPRTYRGKAYVYLRNGVFWSLQQTLLASDGANHDHFGSSVAISGDTIVIGAADNDDKGSNSGSAYVYVRSGTTWTHQQTLLASDGAANDYFGRSVAINGEYIVIGAPQDDDRGTDSGSAYVFVRSGTTWTQQQKLLASDGAANDYFGNSTGISGARIVVGAYGNDSVASNSGAAYVYVRSGITWTQQQKFIPTDGAADDYFGRSVAIDGSTIVVGADGHGPDGAAYVFVRHTIIPDPLPYPWYWWYQQQKIYFDVSGVPLKFGSSVAIDGDTIVGGAPGASDAYVFVRSGGSWNQGQLLTHSDGGAGDYFGYSGAISGENIVVGAPRYNSGIITRGDIYIYELNDPPVANNDSYSTNEDTSLIVTAPGFLGNDTDTEGDPLTATKMSDPAHGTLTFISNGYFYYHPDYNFNGIDNFTYRINDGNSWSNIATVTLMVNPINDPPFDNHDGYSTTVDTILNVPAPGVLDNDVDIEGDPITDAVLVTPPTNGTVILNSNGSFSYTPKAGYSGMDKFLYKASDGMALGNGAFVTIGVSPVNNAPVANDIAVTTNKDIPVAITLAASNPDADPLTYAVVTPPANGILSGIAPSLTYTPNTGYSGTDTFTYKANDGYLDSNIATVTITIEDVNVPPIAENIAATTNEGIPVAITLAASDPDADPLTYSVVTPPASGTLSGTAPSLTYTPNIGYSGTDTFTYQANDGYLDSNIATVTITVQQGTDIPEFPTVALPVIAVIGLMFLFQRRKGT